MVSFSLYIRSMHWSSVSPSRQASLRKVVMETPPSGRYDTLTLLRVGIWAEDKSGSEKASRKRDDIILCLRLGILRLFYHIILLVADGHDISPQTICNGSGTIFR
jgi:hypothetical protein